MNINFQDVIPKFDAILDRGLSSGLGEGGGQVCVEAALCEAMGLPHGDDPRCVAASVRAFKISLNDCPWSSPMARAAGLRDLGIAQLGSLGVIDDVEFVRRLAEATVRKIIPKLFRDLFTADRCETEGTMGAARAARAAAAAEAAGAAAEGAAAAMDTNPDRYLLLSASIALDILRDMKSPGCKWIKYK